MLRLTITREGLIAIGKTGYREAGRAAIEAAARHWWENFLPLHFQNVAYLRYRYAPRNRKYSESKRRGKRAPDGTPAIGEAKPLVFTGRSREAALRAPNIKARARNYETYRADVIINAPAFNFGVGKRIDMRDEVTRTNPSEIATMEKAFAAEWERQLKAQGLRAPRRTRRIAG